MEMGFQTASVESASPATTFETATAGDDLDLSLEVMSDPSVSAKLLPGLGIAVGKTILSKVASSEMHKINAVQHGAKAVLGAAVAGVGLFFGSTLIAGAAGIYATYKGFKAVSEWKKS